jgi:GNAT superfamily N-acetyltransferase
MVRPVVQRWDGRGGLSYYRAELLDVAGRWGACTTLVAVVGRLVAACAAHASSLGLRRLVLQSDEDLVAAHRLYQSMGFQRREDLDAVVGGGGGYRALGYELVF